jgi:pyridoxamine 5'-phosphate oxidase
MTKSEILEFLNANPTCYLATCVNNKPHVRALGLYRADERGIVFQTVDRKDLPKQLKENPNVEICFISSDKKLQVRVSGRATLIEDVEFKKEIAQRRPFVNPWIEERGFDAIPVFRIVDCVAVVWTMATNLSPKQYINL